MSDNEYYSGDYEPEPVAQYKEQEDESNVERKHRLAKPKKKAREAKRLKRLEKGKHPPPPQKETQQRHEEPERETEQEVELCRSNAPK